MGELQTKCCDTSHKNVKCGLLEDIESHLVGTLHTKSYGTSHDKCKV